MRKGKSTVGAGSSWHCVRILDWLLEMEGLDGIEEKLSENFKAKVSKGVETLLSIFEQNIEDSTDWTDRSIYTGATGYALLYYFLSSRRYNKDALKVAQKYVDDSVRLCRGKYVTFLTGDAGPYALGAVIHYRMGDSTRAQQLIENLKQLADIHRIDDISSKLSDEALNGRTGYLYALLFVREEIGESAIGDGLIKKVVTAMLASGENMAKCHPECGAPLMYRWHDSYYLGAAHGIAGILLYLLKLKHMLSEDDLEKINETVDFLMSIRFPSGNFPSSLGSRSDKLVQWCHGAPGFTALLLEAAKVYGSSEYMDAAEKCCDIIWQRGLLKKGYGICHGAAGNAYSFLQMFQATKDPKYLHQAGIFAEFCLDYGKHACNQPDRPLSMFEGLAGTLYFLYDIMDPIHAKFPGF